MRLAMDVRGAFREQRTGKDQWTRAVLFELFSREHELLLLSDRMISDLPANAKAIVLPRGFGWHTKAARFLMKEHPLDAYISSSSYIVPALIGPLIPSIPVVHDLIAFQKEPHDTKAVFIERLTLGRAVRTAKKIAVISQATKHDLLQRYPSIPETKVITIGAGSALSPDNSAQENFIFCPATLSPRKNQARLIRAYTRLPESLREKHPLILAGGRGWNDEEIVTLAKNTPGVEWIGYVSDADYQKKIQSAFALAFPSLYEGFGLPVLDALQSGVPVLISDRGSLKEVAGDAAVLVDPLDESSIAKGLERLLTEKPLRETLIESGYEQAKKFSWKRTVDLLLAGMKT